MKKIRIITVLAFLSFALFSTAQEDEQRQMVLIQGMVMDAISQEGLSNVHLILNRARGNVSDIDGKFSIYFNKADTLVFSHVGYQNFVFTLSDTLVGDVFIAGVFMRSDTLTVGEVIVVPRIMDLKTQIRSTNPGLSYEMINAQNNITSSTYQGLNNQARLGNPSANYSILMQKQKLDAYEKGGIPSEQMLGLNIIGIIPAAIYLLSNGMPQRPDPPPPQISQQEIKRMKELYKKKNDL